MLTADETKLLAYAYAVRHDEEDQDLWFAARDDLLPECHRLWERGYLDRRWHGPDLVYRFSDEAAKAQAVSAMRRSSPADLN